MHLLISIVTVVGNALECLEHLIGHLGTLDLRPVQVASDLTSAIVLAGVRHEAGNQTAHSTSCASVC